MKNRKLFVILIALGLFLMFFNTVAMWVLSAVIWIILLVQVKKTGLFKNKSVSEVSKLRLKRLKFFLTLAGIMFFVSITILVGHNIISGKGETHDLTSFIFVLGSMYVSIILTAGSFFTYLKEKDKI
ncbi:MAG: hypothetical protein PF638_08090 [Candidatus Delongbacteria bacterium]|jgi:hypothetical protein|nr:hypothetical protein [Candidatus Delongbacteria bacterium]